MKRGPGQMASSRYGDDDAMLGTPIAQLGKGAYLLGDRFTAADLPWDTALAWTTAFQWVPPLPDIQAYVERIAARPAVARVKARDAELAAAQD